MNIPKILGLKGKDLQLGDFGQTTKFIADKLKEGWVIIMGDMETIEMIESVVYTPGTSKNEDFALIMGKIVPDDETITTLYLAKKTELFKQRIMYWCNIEEDVYDRLIIINIIPSKIEGGVIWDYSLRGDGDGDEFYDNLSKEIVRNELKMEK